MKRWICFETVVALLVLLWLVGNLPILGWISDLASHFQMQYAIFSLGCILYAFKKRLWKPLAPLLVVFALTAFAVIPYWPNFKASNASISQPHIRLMQVNVLYQNQGHRRVQRAIELYDPDILSLQEVDPRWINGLQPILKKYPYRLEHIVWKRSCGLALYSKMPLRNLQIRDYGNVGRAVLLSDIQLGTQTVTIAAMHPHSPGRIARYENRNRQFFTFARERKQLNSHLILLGDLNNTPFSSSFKEFLKITHLKDTRVGQGLYPTWPSILPLLWVPIDHVLVSPEFEVESFKTGPYTGSDHFPVVVDLALESSFSTKDSR